MQARSAIQGLAFSLFDRMSQLNMNNRQNNNNGRRRGRNTNSNNNRPQSGGRGADQANRIDSRARGNAAQMIEKFRNLARDAQLAGDRVQTEYYLQFADHYFRVLSDFRQRQEERAVQNGYDRQPDRQREIRGVEDFDGHDDSDLDNDSDNRTVSAEQDGGDDNREARGQRESRDYRDNRDNRESRGQRDYREARAPRGDRDSRDQRDSREVREPREPREHRETRDNRDQRDEQTQRPVRDEDEARAPRPARGRPLRRDRSEDVAPVLEAVENTAADVGNEEAASPRRRGPRRPRVDESLSIDSAALPPAIGRPERSEAESEVAAEKPVPALKPRRPRRTAAARDADVEVAE